MIRLWIFIMLLVLISSCVKKDNMKNPLIGTWRLEQVTGGLHGTGYDPGFKFLELRNRPSCSFLDSLKRTIGEGYYFLRKKANKHLINFVSDSDSVAYEFIDIEKQYYFSGSDTLMMDEGCCDLFQYLFVRE